MSRALRERVGLERLFTANLKREVQGGARAADVGPAIN